MVRYEVYQHLANGQPLDYRVGNRWIKAREKDILAVLHTIEGDLDVVRIHVPFETKFFNIAIAKPLLNVDEGQEVWYWNSSYNEVYSCAFNSNVEFHRESLELGMFFETKEAAVKTWESITKALVSYKNES